MIIELVGKELKNAPLYNSPKNQLKRAVGKYTTIYQDSDCGTIQDQNGKYWDWWTTDQVIKGTGEQLDFKKLVVVPAQ